MRRFVWLVALAFCVPDPPVTHAQTGTNAGVSASRLEADVDSAVAIRRNTQKQEDTWAQERADLVARYQQLKAHVALLTESKSVSIERAAELQADVDEYTRRLDESERFEAGLQDTLLAIFGRLETHVTDDLPFLMDERTARLQSVRTDLVRTDVEPAEKLRRLLEALLIEAQYGVGSEVYEEDIEVGGQPLAVNVLRLGRLAIFWQTPDGERAGDFDRATETWVERSGSERRAINSAMDMAARRRPHEVIALPLGRIAP